MLTTPSQYLFSEKLVLNGGVNLGAKIPEQILLLDTSKSFKFSEKALNFDMGLSYKVGDAFRTGISMYIASLTDIVYHRELYLFPDEAHTYNDMNYGINTFFEISWKGFELYANYSNHNSDKAYYYYTPKHNAFASLSKEYDFGLKWTFEAKYSGERNSPNISSESASDFVLFNSRVSQKIAERFEIYVDLNNITNEYYEYIPGYPQPGFIFAAGIKILIGERENE